MITEVVERGYRAEDEKSELRIFINENLTQKPQELLATARNIKRARKFNQVWTVHSEWTVDVKIFPRKTEDSRPVRINDLRDLENVMKRTFLLVSS